MFIDWKQWQSIEKETIRFSWQHQFGLITHIECSLVALPWYSLTFSIPHIRHYHRTLSANEIARNRHCPIRIESNRMNWSISPQLFMFLLYFYQRGYFQLCRFLYVTWVVIVVTYLFHLFGTTKIDHQHKKIGHRWTT